MIELFKRRNVPNQDQLSAERITAAICRMINERGDSCLREFTLKSGRRVDIIALSRDGTITIIEVKSSRHDFQSDRKWHEYLEWGDRFFFAVAETFPQEILPGPDQCGIIVTDGFDCLIAQNAPETRLNAQRRNHLIKRLAHNAMCRLEFGIDGEPENRSGQDQDSVPSRT